MKGEIPFLGKEKQPEPERLSPEQKATTFVGLANKVADEQRRMVKGESLGDPYNPTQLPSFRELEVYLHDNNAGTKSYADGLFLRLGRYGITDPSIAAMAQLPGLSETERNALRRRPFTDLPDDLGIDLSRKSYGVFDPEYTKEQERQALRKGMSISIETASDEQTRERQRRIYLDRARAFEAHYGEPPTTDAMFAATYYDPLESSHEPSSPTTVQPTAEEPFYTQQALDEGAEADRAFDEMVENVLKEYRENFE